MSLELVPPLGDRARSYLAALAGPVPPSEAVALAVAAGDLAPGAASSAALVSPPVSNRGGENTVGVQEVPKRALVDYLRFTVQDENLLPWAKKLLTPSPEDWSPSDSGLYLYAKAWRCGPFLLLTDGMKPNMGFCVQVSGQACRELEDSWKLVDEATGEVTFRRSWPDFLAELLEKGASPTRLDVALDDLTGALDLGAVRAAAVAETYTCRSRFVDVHESRRGGGKNGLSITFGRRDSSTRVLRFYDKVAEQLAKRKPVEVDYWVRCELECIGERAELMARLLSTLTTEEARLQAVAGCIREFVDFKEAGADSNLSRCETASWWSAFLGGWEKVKLALAPIVRTFEKSEAWLHNQVATTLAMVSSAKDDAGAFLTQLLEAGKEKLRPRQLGLVQRERCRQAARVRPSPPDREVWDPFACDPQLLELAELFPRAAADDLSDLLERVKRAQMAKQRRQEWAAAVAR